MHNIKLPQGCTDHTPWYYFGWLSQALLLIKLQDLKNTLNLALGGIFVLPPLRKSYTSAPAFGGTGRYCKFDATVQQLFG